MIHAQHRREPTATTPATGLAATVSPPASRDADHPDRAEAVVPPQQKRRPDAYDLYAEIFAIRTESRPA